MAIPTRSKCRYRSTIHRRYLCIQTKGLHWILYFACGNVLMTLPLLLKLYMCQASLIIPPTCDRFHVKFILSLAWNSTAPNLATWCHDRLLTDCSNLEHNHAPKYERQVRPRLFPDGRRSQLQRPMLGWYSGALLSSEGDRIGRQQVVPPPARWRVVLRSGR
jgi:hypothetical protein